MCHEALPVVIVDSGEFHPGAALAAQRHRRVGDHDVDLAGAQGVEAGLGIERNVFDRIALASQRVSRAPKPADFVILPDIISKEPLGPVTRDDDLQWNEIVAWTLNAMLTAEEKGITMATVDNMRQSKDQEIRRLLGVEGKLGASLGLDGEWAYRIIKQVGNYGEVFERNLGGRSPLALERGQNALWSSGGLLYSPPFR